MLDGRKFILILPHHFDLLFFFFFFFPQKVLSHRRLTSGEPDKSERVVDKLTASQFTMLETFLIKAGTSRRVGVECLKRAKWVPEDA